LRNPQLGPDVKTARRTRGGNFLAHRPPSQV
jgi:hypothetical protein